ncbi:MAG: putative pre-16S rRNA nuclease [Micavibrio sp.]|nr:MAG: putative pre-16S rRNA nuclease [Micavibrio sp.]
MPIGLLKDIIDCAPKDVRLLGMDPGTKTIGLAVSDPAHSIATPLKTIKRTKFTKDIEELRQVIADYEIGGFVLGYPVNMDGTEGKRCQSVRDFAQEMGNHADIFGDNPWIALWDERLSTETVESFLVESVDMSRTKRKHVVDKLAAQHILQGALDFIQAALI